MTREEIIEAVHNLTEDRIRKLVLDKWLEIELTRIVNRKHYWWRKKTFSFTCSAGTPIYDLSANGLNIADDFDQMVTFVRWDSSDNVVPMSFISDPQDVLTVIYDTSTGTPTGWLIEPGTTQTIRLAPVPSSSHTFRGLYWAGINTKWSTPGSGTIPLIPPQFHYVVLVALTRRAFQYLYGQKDARYATALQEEMQAMKELAAYVAPTTDFAIELRSYDPNVFVQSTK